MPQFKKPKMENINELIEHNLNFIKNKSNSRIRRLELKNTNDKTLSVEECISLHKILIEKNLLFESEHKDLFLTGISEEIILNGGWLKQLNSENQKSENAELKERLDKELKILQKESLEYQKTIREQSDRIRNLDEQIKILSLLKEYWWFIGVCIIFGGLLKEFLERIGIIT
jgi:hypothetical protein